ncbi:MAG: CvpA family protein [Gammaproteobacteria bacterium]|nr:CvpA family protein [Gammaproteobacteria bacterium]
MSGIDYLLLCIITISAVIGLWRGLVREVMSLIVWAMAFWLAYIETYTVAGHLVAWISDKGVRLVTAFLLVFVAVYLIGFIVSHLLTKLVQSVGMTATDRIAGSGFGLVRGVVLVSTLVLVVGMTPMIKESAWQHSYMVGVFDNMLHWVQHQYPVQAGDLTQALKFGQAEN